MRSLYSEIKNSNLILALPFCLSGARYNLKEFDENHIKIRDLGYHSVIVPPTI